MAAPPLFWHCVCAVSPALARNPSLSFSPLPLPLALCSLALLAKQAPWNGCRRRGRTALNPRARLDRIAHAMNKSASPAFEPPVSQSEYCGRSGPVLAVQQKAAHANAGPGLPPACPDGADPSKRPVSPRWVVPLGCLRHPKFAQRRSFFPFLLTGRPPPHPDRMRGSQRRSFTRKKRLSRRSCGSRNTDNRKSTCRITTHGGKTPSVPDT